MEQLAGLRELVAELDGLLLQLNPEANLNFMLDGVAKGSDVGKGGVVCVDESEGVTGGDSGVAHEEAFVEACALEEPGGGELDEAFACGPVRDLVGRDSEGGWRFRSRTARGDDGVFEEGACAAAVGFAFDDQHALAVADLANGVVDVDGFRCGGLFCEVVLQVGVGEGRRGVQIEVITRSTSTRSRSTPATTPCPPRRWRPPGFDARRRASCSTSRRLG